MPRVCRWLSLALLALLLSSVAGCRWTESQGMLLSGTPWISTLEDGNGEILVQQPFQIDDVGLDRLTRVTVDPTTSIALDSGRFVSGKSLNSLPEYLEAQRRTNVEVTRSGAILTAGRIWPAESNLETLPLDGWPVECGETTGTFVGILGESSGQWTNKSSGSKLYSASFEFTTPELPSQGPNQWYVVTAWSPEGESVTVDGRAFDVAKNQEAFTNLVDQKLVTLQLVPRNGRWWLKSVKTIGPAAGAWPPVQQ